MDKIADLYSRELPLPQYRTAMATHSSSRTRNRPLPIIICALLQYALGGTENKEQKQDIEWILRLEFGWLSQSFYFFYNGY